MVETAKKPKEAKKPKKGASKQKKAEKVKETEAEEQPHDAEDAEEKGQLRKAGSQASSSSKKLASSSSKKLSSSSSKKLSSSKTDLQQITESATRKSKTPSTNFSEMKFNANSASSRTLRGSMKIQTRSSLGTEYQKSVLFTTPEAELGQLPKSSSYLIGNKIFDDTPSSSTTSSDDEGEGEGRQEKKDRKKKKKDKHIEEIVVPKTSSMQVRRSKAKGKKREESKTAIVDKSIELRNTIIEKTKLKDLPAFLSTGSLSIYSKEADSPEVQKKHKKGKGKPKVADRKKGKIGKELSQKLKLEQEQEAAKKAAEEKIRLEQEALAAIEKVKREALENQLRNEQLEKCFNHLQVMVDNNLELAQKEKEQEEWEFYLKCGKLPHVSDCGAMTTYIHLWLMVLQESTIKDVSARTKDVMELLENIEDVQNGPSKLDDTKLENLNWVRQKLRDSLEDSLTVVTLRLISNIEANLHHIDPFTADFNFQDEYLTFNIWLRVPMPISLPNPRKPMKPKIEIEFTNLNMSVIFPLCIPGENMAIRVMHLKYDHLSDRCETYYMSRTSSRATQTLLDVTNKEWRVKQAYMSKNTDRFEEETSQLLPTTISTLSLDKGVSLSLQEVSSSMACLVEEYLEYEDDKKRLEVDVISYAANMREYRVLGGIYYINLIRQPLQPQHLVIVDLTTVKYFLPKTLELAEYGETVTTLRRVSSVRASRSSVVSEMIMKKQSEEEQEKRLKVLLKKPNNVVFFEPPAVGYWDEDTFAWIYEAEDVEYDEDVVIFKVQTYGAFGLLAPRYVNLPYQHWKVTPNAGDSSIDVEVKTRMMDLVFRVKGDSVALTRAANSPNDEAFRLILDKPMKLHKLIKHLREIGVDVFPDFDAFLYVDPNYEKQWAMEEHLYLDMAKLSHTFKFARSKWNSQAGFRNIILQMREINPTRTAHKCLLHVTPLKATVLRTTETSDNMSLEEADNIRFSADLYNLMKVTSGIAVRKMIEDASQETTMGVYKLLKATRFLSYS